MGFRALLTLFFVNICTHMNAKDLNFTITGKPIPGRCEKFQTKYSRWNYASSIGRVILNGTYLAMK